MGSTMVSHQRHSTHSLFDIQNPSNYSLFNDIAEHHSHLLHDSPPSATPKQMPQANFNSSSKSDLHCPVLDEISGNTDTDTDTKHSLRRMKAYSRLIEQAKDQKQQNTPPTGHYLFTAPSFDSLTVSPTSSFASFVTANDAATSHVLQHKDKFEDLRYQFSNSELATPRGYNPFDFPWLNSSSSGSSHDNSSDSILVALSVIGAGTSNDTLDSSSNTQATTISKQTQEQPQEYIYCICRRSFDIKLGGMVICKGCGEWYHLKCIGVACHSAQEFEDKSFFCSGCEDNSVLNL